MTVPTLTHYMCFTSGVLDFEADDTFTRADNALVMGDADSGQQWFPAVGTAGIASNKAYFAALSGGKGLAYLRSLAGGTVAVTLSTHAAGCGLAARIQDASNYWLLYDNTTNYKVALVEAGVATVKDTIAVVPANGDVLQFTLAGSTITGKVNSTSGTPVEDLTFKNEARAGIYAESTSARFDSFSADFVWTNISSYVREFSHERGRQHELDKAESGTAKYTLAFTAREFEPAYSGSVFYPFIQPMRRIKTVATYSSTDTGRFYGFVERWPIEWPGSGVAVEAEVQIDAVDYLAVAAYAIFDAYVPTVLGMNPDWYFRFGESASTASDSGPNGYADATATDTEIALPGLLPAIAGDNGGLGQVVSGVSRVDYPLTIAPTGTQNFTVAGLLSVEQADAFTDQVWFADYAGADVMYVQIEIMAGMTTGERGVTFFDGGTTNSVQHDSYSISDGNPHMFVAVRDATNSELRLYIDGVLSDSTAHTARNLATCSDHSTQFTATAGASGVVDEFSKWDRCLTQDEITALAVAAGVAGGPAQTTGERVGLIADLLGFSPSQRLIDEGLSTMQRTYLSDKTPRESLDLAEDTEDGTLFINGDGYIVFLDRADPYEQITHETWGDLDDPSENHYESVVPSYDIDRVRNDIRLQRTDSITAVAVDLPSQNEFGLLNLSRTVEHDTDSETQKHADWLLTRYKDVQLRVDGIDIKGWVSDPAAVLATDIGTRVTVKRRPASGGDPMSFECILEGLAETWTSDGDWQAGWQLSPVPTVWVLGDPIYSILGETTVLGW